MLHVVLAAAQPILAGSFEWPDVSIKTNFLVPIAVMGFMILWHRGRGLHRYTDRNIKANEKEKD